MSKRILFFIKYLYHYWNRFKFSVRYSLGIRPSLPEIDRKVHVNSGLKYGIAAFTMMKDEEDIVEHFIRINSAWCSHFFIYDDGSSDGTVDIIDGLVNEGFPITLLRGGGLTYQQNYISTYYVREIAALSGVDFICPIDSDEFIFESLGFIAELDSLGRDKIGYLNWRSLVPCNGDTVYSSSAFSTGFESVVIEAAPSRKVVIPARLGPSIYVDMGNHSAFQLMRQSKKYVFEIKISHAPVRTCSQVLVKSLIGSYKFRIKKNKTRGEGSHWLAMAKKYRENGYIVSDADLRNIAYNYVASHVIGVDRNLVKFNPAFNVYDLKYGKFLKRNVIPQFDNFVVRLLGENRF